jgi:hypothetical protein
MGFPAGYLFSGERERQARTVIQILDFIEERGTGTRRVRNRL